MRKIPAPISRAKFTALLRKEIKNLNLTGDAVQLSHCCGIEEIRVDSLIDTIECAIDSESYDANYSGPGFPIKMFKKELKYAFGRHCRNERIAGLVFTNIKRPEMKEINALLTSICGTPTYMGVNPKSGNKLYLWTYRNKTL